MHDIHFGGLNIFGLWYKYAKHWKYTNLTLRVHKCAQGRYITTSTKRITWTKDNRQHDDALKLAFSWLKSPLHWCNSFNAQPHLISIIFSSQPVLEIITYTINKLSNCWFLDENGLFYSSNVGNELPPCAPCYCRFNPGIRQIFVHLILISIIARKIWPLAASSQCLWWLSLHAFSQTQF